MEIAPLTVTDIHSLASTIDSLYANFPIAAVNDHVIRMGIMTEPYYWHMHPNSDESFLVMEGSIYIDLEDRTIKLGPGQCFTIPQSVKHRTRPVGARSVNLTFEHRDMRTIRIDL
jgi:mannose-6-phosphate isomerase-like protein (cupin superfamily)